jgi:succinyl-CoA synthetase beta subunit
MRLFEYQSKGILKEFGIPTPNGSVVTSSDEVASTLQKLALPVAIKAQVLLAVGESRRVLHHKGTAQSKIESLRDAEAKIADRPSDVTSLVEELLKK